MAKTAKHTVPGDEYKTIIDAAEKIRAEGFAAGLAVGRRSAVDSIIAAAKAYLQNLDNAAEQPKGAAAVHGNGGVTVTKKGDRYLRALAMVKKNPGVRADQVLADAIAAGDKKANLNAIRTTLSRLKADKVAVSSGGHWYPPPANEGGVGIDLSLFERK